MEIQGLIEGTFDDYRNRLATALAGLTTEELAWRPDHQSNSIGFILWHLARVEDRWICYFVRGAEDIWVKNDWYKKFGLAELDHGVGFTLEQVAHFPALTLAELLDYVHEVHRETTEFVQQLHATDLDVVPGRIPFPPSTPRGSEAWTIGRMFRQLFGELNQHLGQIRYLRGMIRGFNQ
jgi:uncharacterized damage-inducible protein DinB